MAGLLPAQLNALTAQWAGGAAELDDSENRSRINYNNALDQLRRQKESTMGRVGVQMSGQGLGQSGIRGQQEIKTMDDYNRASGLRAQQQQLSLATVARKRLQLQAERDAQAAVLQQQALMGGMA